MPGSALRPLALPAATQRQPTFLADALLLVVCIVVAGIASILAGQDANWDLQNYHFYNPWAWLGGRIFGPDVAVAQLQTFHNPLFDVPFHAMVALDWPPRAIAFALAVPTGIAAFLLILLSRLLFADLEGVERHVAVAASVVIGVTSSMGRATLGTTMNEWILAAFVLAGLWLVVRTLVRADRAAVPVGALVASGILVGIATGGKLTAGSFAVAICIALVLRGPFTWRATAGRFGEATLMGIGILTGFVIAYGPWGHALWTHYASPIFPYGNEWIASPWWSQQQVIGRLYGPKDLGAWLRFPFDMYAPGPSYVGEVDYRDARMPLLYGMALIGGIVWLWVWLAQRGRVPALASAGSSRAWRFLSAFFIASFLLWTAQHANYRYLITLDALAGVLIITLVHRNLRPGHAPVVMIAVAIFLVVTTKAGSWGRIDFGKHWFEVDAPPLAPEALVVTTTDAPLSYVIPLLRPTPAAAVGIDNNIVNARHTERLYDEVSATIRAHPGPIYALSSPAGAGGDALARRGLARIAGSCVRIRSTMPSPPLELCRVTRADAVTPTP